MADISVPATDAMGREAKVEILFMKSPAGSDLIRFTSIDGGQTLCLTRFWLKQLVSKAVAEL